MGRADGIIISRGGDKIFPPGLPENGAEPESGELVTVTIDEIKGTYRDIHKMKEAVPVHLAQAKCYAHIYGIQNGLKHIRVRLTYCNIDTEEIRYFHFAYEKGELEKWFEELMGQYRKWADFQFAWQKERQASIKNLSFPFPYRKGQKELASYRGGKNYFHIVSRSESLWGGNRAEDFLSDGKDHHQDSGR